MRISDILTVCLRNLSRRKVRTALTVIGVVIGACAIILMISLGIGVKQSMENMMAQWGDLTIISVYNYSKGGKTKLDDNMVSKIQQMDGVDIATPFYRVTDPGLQLKTRNGRYVAGLQIVGVYPEALEKLGFALTEGSYLPKGDKNYNLLVGGNVAYAFLDSKRKDGGYIDRNQLDANGNPKAPYVKITKDKLTLFALPAKTGGKSFEVTPRIVGVLKEDFSKGYETSEGVFMDINVLKSLIAQYNKQNNIPAKNQKTAYEEVRVKCTDAKLVAGIQQSIKELGFECSSMQDTRDMINKQISQAQAMLGGLAAISLLVAAIGIANTMVMSIYERTKEIGVMKVIGARIHDIRTMFLTESAMIGLFGGTAGVALSFTVSAVLNSVGGGLLASAEMGAAGAKLSIIPWWLVAMAMMFSMLIGVIFGFIPANRAVKISALEAIRHD